MFVYIAFAVVLLIISINDFLFFRIEDEYVVALLVVSGLSYLCGCSNGFLFNMLVTAFIFAVTFVMNQYDLIGGGDVKFLVPLMMFCADRMSEFIYGISIAGVVVAAIYILCSEGIYNFRRFLIYKIFCLARKRKSGKSAGILNIVLLSFSRIGKSSEVLVKTTSVLRQEIPYGVVLSCGGFFVICDKLVSR